MMRVQVDAACNVVLIIERHGHEVLRETVTDVEDLRSRLAHAKTMAEIRFEMETVERSLCPRCGAFPGGCVRGCGGGIQARA